jgi:hypothetical protein
MAEDIPEFPPEVAGAADAAAAAAAALRDAEAGGATPAEIQRLQDELNQARDAFFDKLGDHYNFDGDLLKQGIDGNVNNQAVAQMGDIIKAQADAINKALEDKGAATEEDKRSWLEKKIGKRMTTIVMSLTALGTFLGILELVATGKTGCYQVDRRSGGSGTTQLHCLGDDAGPSDCNCAAAHDPTGDIRANCGDPDCTRDAQGDPNLQLVYVWQTYNIGDIFNEIPGAINKAINALGSDVSSFLKKLGMVALIIIGALLLAFIIYTAVRKWGEHKIELAKIKGPPPPTYAFRKKYR